jgi:tryptophan-rich sensory protein
MRRWDWLPHALVALAALGALYFLVRLASREWGERWLAFRRRPRWLQAAAALALVWLALRISRLGWRALLTYVAILVALAVWGELAAHDRRRAGSRGS